METLNFKIRLLQSASELYRPRDRRLSAKLVATFEDRGSHVVSVTDPYARILGFLERIVDISAEIKFQTQLHTSFGNRK
jgi:hypothetical protein